MATTDQAQPTSTGGTAYHMGDMSLIRFDAGSGIPTTQVWLLDNKRKEMRPFASQQAFLDAYAGNTDAAHQAIVTVHAADRAPGGILSSYEMLPASYAVQGDGSYAKTDASKAELSATYGKDPVDYATYEKMINFVGGFLSSLQKENSGISSGFLDTLKNDPVTVAKYINAATYGGYTPSDIYRDIKRKELISQGNTDRANTISPISASTIRSEYANTNEGKAALTTTSTNPPVQVGGLDPNIMNYPIFNLPDEAFKTLVQPLKSGSPEEQAAMDKIQASAYDIAIKQMEATTESEKAYADHLYQQFKTDTERSLGIKLANNSIDAWKQIEGIREQFSTRGIQGSGIQNENVDDYLRNIRRGDQIERTNALTDEEAKKAAYYKSSASSAEIAALTPEEKAKYGLTPSADIKNSMSFGVLKQKYPSLTDSQINNYIASMFDENGNYRSTLYGTQIKNTQSLATDKASYQKTEAQNANVEAEKAAGKQFTDKALTVGGVFNRDATPTGAIGANVSTSSTKPTVSNPTPGGLAPDDPSNKFNTSTGVLNTKYKAPITTTPTSTPVTAQTQTPVKKYGTLSDYYSANGGTNTWNSTKRQADATKAGITGYTGLAGENTKLLDYLQK